MSILYDEQQNVFHLKAGETSYVMQVVREKYLAHLYWGKKLGEWHKGSRAILYIDRQFEHGPDAFDRTFSLGTLPQEYPQYGNGDFRSCAYGICNEAGSRISSLTYAGYEIRKGKPPIPGLPASFGPESEVDTLTVHMEDEAAGLLVDLYYSAFEKTGVITRSACFKNQSGQKLKLEKMLSMSVDIREDDFDVLTLYGAHNNERNMDRRPLTSGCVQTESLRGTSSPQQSPFMALLRKGADERQGEVFAASFVYSGNFTALAQVDPFRNVRFQMGMNPWNGQWLLEPGETFWTPEAVMVYSAQGLGGMSRTFHRFYQRHLVRGKFANEERPVLLNSWEAAFFDFDEEKLLGQAKRAAAAGIELFVLDDGWFGRRDDDTSSLGDWYVDKRKLPGGLARLEEGVHRLGMGFGLWVEPEMVSQDSDLYRQHPDYVLHTQGRPYTYGRSQLVLDLSRREVCQRVLEDMTRVLGLARIDYVKWDMNRQLTDVGSSSLPPERQGEVHHRYMLGLYWIMEQLVNRFPDILFESCASGGGRFDAGMLYYMPQTWCSDNTDAVCRMKIQYATSFMFPPVTMGAHVSGTPNQQTGRNVPLGTRGAVAMSANLGYELDLMKCSQKELRQIAGQVSFYKKIRKTIEFGEFYRLHNPFEENLAAWNFVSRDGQEVVAFWFEILSEGAPSVKLLKLEGLEETAHYENVETKEIYGGDELMYSGISIPLKKQDFRSECYRFRKI